MNSLAFMAIWPMPEVVAMVSATISVSHIKPSEYRSPTNMEGKAPGKMIWLNN